MHESGTSEKHFDTLSDVISNVCFLYIYVTFCFQLIVQMCWLCKQSEKSIHTSYNGVYLTQQNQCEYFEIKLEMAEYE